ncbi:glycosyltransferase [Candidatus Micrarchaeota archaeon]|nr:glycosyltransferase [Candidatus Micrarchaeota archaeon]
MDYSDTTVVIPTLNEEKNIKSLIPLLLKYKKINIIVVDDGSMDATLQILRNFSSKNRQVDFIDRKEERIHGLTISVLDGLQKTKTKYAIVMDGDLQHPPEKVGQMVQKLKAGSDLVIGVRTSVFDDWPIHRRLMSIGASSIGFLRLLISGKTCNDVLSGFFGINVNLAKKLIGKNSGKFEMEGYKVLFDFLKLLPKNSKLSEVPYRFGERSGGSSKINSRHVKIFFKSVFR